MLDQLSQQMTEICLVIKEINTKLKEPINVDDAASVLRSIVKSEIDWDFYWDYRTTIRDLSNTIAKKELS